MYTVAMIFGFRWYGATGRLNLKEPNGGVYMHHYYYGVLMIALAYALSTLMATWIFWSLTVMGFILIVDDLYQHAMNVQDTSYESPIHKLYVKYLHRTRMYICTYVWPLSLWTWDDNL